MLHFALFFISFALPAASYARDSANPTDTLNLSPKEFLEEAHKRNTPKIQPIPIPASWLTKSAIVAERKDPDGKLSVNIPDISNRQFEPGTRVIVVKVEKRWALIRVVQCVDENAERINPPGGVTA